MKGIKEKKGFEPLREYLESQSIDQGLNRLHAEFPGEIVFSTSFSLEDQVITQAIVQSGIPISIFTLDTGRLFPETYSTWERSLDFFKIKIKTYLPNARSLEALIQKNGPNGFFNSVQNRKDCCQIRKVDPLKRALKGMKVWISGLRTEHSPDREFLKILEWDEINQVFKYYPLLHHKEADLKKIILSYGIPYNILVDKGFPSIGCAPCTRSVKPGEPLRSGRWWWEDQTHKECGLHEIQKS
jgi:phosphoadenosine phosphosulfate reductase